MMLKYNLSNAMPRNKMAIKIYNFHLQYFNAVYRPERLTAVKTAVMVFQVGTHLQILINMFQRNVSPPSLEYSGQ
jgi:hypothetical protein